MRLEATNIIAGYTVEPVLEAVSAAVETGEFVGLIGPNGCGKSTLLRVLSGILALRAGSVQLDGREIAAWSARERARRLAFVPQEESAVFDFTVRDVVLMGRYPHRARGQGDTVEDYARVTDALAQADILHLADRFVTQLSGGEHRRVLLARALAQQTPLLLLDEPTAHLDITHQIELLSRIRQHTRAGEFGALAALHDLNQAAEFCDRLILLRGGRVLAEGPPETVLTAPNLRRAYDAFAQIGRNPATDRPMLLTLHPAREEMPHDGAPSVHVICGGGSGIGVMGALRHSGFSVSAGVLNRGDSDAEAADALKIETALEEPFSEIGPASRARCAQLMSRADTIFITSVPFGEGNLANLELTLEAQQAGKSIVLLGDTPDAARDFTKGAATRLLDLLRQGGAQRLARLEDWLDRETPQLSSS